MALPRTLPTEFQFPQYASNLGPFYVNGAVYIVGLEYATNTYVQVWKSSDPNSSAFSMQDADQAEVLNGTENWAGGVSVWLDGDTLHMVALSTAWDSPVKYFRFDTASDTWTDGHNAWGEVVADFGGDGDPSFIYADIRVHTVSSDEWIEIAYNSGTDKEMGVQRDRVKLATFDGSGTTWTIQQAWDDFVANANNDYGNHGLTLSGDRVHGIVAKNSSVYAINTITASGTINLWTATTAVSVVVTSGWGTGVSNGTTCNHATVSGTDTTPKPTIEFTSADSPGTITANEVYDYTPPLGPYRRAAITLVGTDVYRWYARASDGDFYYDLNDGSDVSAFSLTLDSSDRCSASIADYTVGGRNVIGIIYNDGGTQEYNEFSLAAPPDDFPVVPHEALQLSAIPARSRGWCSNGPATHAADCL
jgi:hypothetical protein